MSNATAPGMINTAIAGQIAPAAAMTAATRSGPATAPTWSRALCMPKPRPSPTAAAAWASSAVFAGLRTAFPTRSPRMRRQASASPAPATKGVMARAGTQIAVRA